MLMRSAIGALTGTLMGICGWGMLAAPAAAQCDWEQVDTMLAAGPPERDRFGTSVAVSGTTAIIGAPYDSEKGEVAGAAYIFELDGGEWKRVAKLTADDASARAFFGRAVAVSGDTVIIGAYGDGALGRRAGAAYVFERVGGEWTQVAALRASDGHEGAVFGWSVSISGATIVVGANRASGAGKNESGAAYVFERIGGVWTEVAILVASDGQYYDHFGFSVAVDGSSALVGALHVDAAGPSGWQTLVGAAYVFEKQGGQWEETAKLVGEIQGGLLGAAVSLSGETALVSAPREGDQYGAAYIFERDAGAWTRLARLDASDRRSGDYFGDSVSLHGDLAVVGTTQGDGSGVDSGAAYIFRNVGGSWVETSKIAAVGGLEDSRFGLSVATNGSAVLAGAPWRDPSHEPGAVYAFEQFCGCFADCDGNGELEFSDFLCFQNEFAAGNGGADCDRDFNLTFFDFLCFQQSFAAGCP